MSSLSKDKIDSPRDRLPSDRRVKNLGPKDGVERRDIADRRTENNVEFVTFYIGRNLLGVPVESVQEVVPAAQKVTAIPRSSKEIKGLMNLRGQIVTVMNLRTRLGIGEVPDSKPMNVIIRYGQELLSLEVDSVGDVLPCSKSMLLVAPPTLEGHWKNICQKVLQMNKGLMLVVSIEKIFGFNVRNENGEKK